jgi:CHASE3 domain sensor protein
MPHRKPSLLFAATTATLVMSITAAVGPISLFWTNVTRTERNSVEHQLDSIRVLQSLLVDAETGERGYALTGKEKFLQPYYVARSQLPEAIRSLRHSYENDFHDEVEKVETLIGRAEQKMSHLDAVVKLRSERGAEVAASEVANGNGKQLMDSVRDMSEEMIRAETQEVGELDDKLNTNLLWAALLSLVCFILTLSLGRFIYVTMRVTIRRQTDSAAAAKCASTQLGESLDRLERSNREIGLLAEMARLLQTEMTQEETLQLASSYCQHWCLPLMAYGEVLGLLHIRHIASPLEVETSLQFAEAAAEQTALALANGKMRQVLRVQSVKDPLTGLYNRRFMEHTLERELARARRDGSALSLIMLDLDNFKVLNDLYGHSSGDEVLRAAAEVLTRSMRASDVVCRYGGGSC